MASRQTGDDATLMLTNVPASKEDIFKTKALTLIAKRKLMKLLMYIGTEDWQSDLSRDPDLARMPFVSYLAEVHNMSPNLVDAVAYGLCLCATPKETTEVAMKRAKSHMQSVGKYGNSAYLVGQYGGAGELAQGYCRASAVKGGMFILAHEIKSVKRVEEENKWQIGIDGIEELVTADYLVASDEMLQELDLGNTQLHQVSASQLKAKVLYKAILVLDRPISFTSVSSGKELAGESDANDAAATQSQELPPETGLVVFPPGSISGNANTVTVLMMGEGTFSCPKGQYVYYVQTEACENDADRSALETLKPFIDQVVCLSNEAQPSEGTAFSQPLLQMTYRHLVSMSPNETTTSNLSRMPFPPPYAAQTSTPATSISGLADAAVHLAEDVYFDIVASRLPLSKCGNTNEEKLNWIKEALEKQRLERKRQKRRDPTEYQGRGGRGADDGITRERDDEQKQDEGQETQVVGFFESLEDGDDDNDDVEEQ